MKEIEIINANLFLMNRFINIYIKLLKDQMSKAGLL